MMIRLDKFLADMGYGTRSQVKKELAKGSVTAAWTVGEYREYYTVMSDWV